MILQKGNQKFLVDGAGEELYTACPPHAYHHLTRVHGYESTSVDCRGILISDDILKSDFVPIENFQDVSYDPRSKAIQVFYTLHKHKDMDIFIRITKGEQYYEPDREDEAAPEGMSVLACVFFKSESPTLTRDIQELNKLLSANNNGATVSVVLKTMQGFTFKQCNIKPLPVDITTMYNDDFAEVYERVTDKLVNGNKGVILFHGAPGTGKTNLIKHLTTVVPNKRFVFIPVNMIQFLTDPAFMGALLENQDCVLVLEDCENYIKERGGSGSDYVSSILNISDGIMSDILSLQIICTFNGKIGQVDSALLRKGRLIAEYEFKPLVDAKAKQLASSLGVELGGQPTLAEIFNAQEKAFRAQGRTRIGFNNA